MSWSAIRLCLVTARRCMLHFRIPLGRNLVLQYSYVFTVWSQPVSESVCSIHCNYPLYAVGSKKKLSPSRDCGVHFFACHSLYGKHYAHTRLWQHPKKGLPIATFIIEALQINSFYMSSYNCLVPMPHLKHLTIGLSKLLLSSGLHQAVFSVVFELTHVKKIFKTSHHW